MSEHKCGCVYADAKNTPAVRNGYEVGGYLKTPCKGHAAMNTHPNDEKPYSEEEVARAREVLIDALRNSGAEETARIMSRTHDRDDWWAASAIRAICAALRTASQPATPAGASEAPVAWMDPDGSRVIPAKVKEDGSAAYRSATSGYSIPLYTHPTLHQPPSGEWVMVQRADLSAILAFIFRHFGDVSRSQHLTDQVVAAVRSIEKIAAARPADG